SSRNVQFKNEQGANNNAPLANRNAQRVQTSSARSRNNGEAASNNAPPSSRLATSSVAYNNRRVNKSVQHASKRKCSVPLRLPMLAEAAASVAVVAAHAGARKRRTNKHCS